MSKEPEKKVTKNKKGGYKEPKTIEEIYRKLKTEIGPIGINEEKAIKQALAARDKYWLDKIREALPPLTASTSQGEIKIYSTGWTDAVVFLIKNLEREGIKLFDQKEDE